MSTAAAPTRRSAMPGILAGVLLVYMVLLGGSEVGVFLAPLQVINAAIGAVLVAVWIRWLARGTDLADRLIMGALVFFLAACVTSTYPRQSFDAATAALTWAAAFGVGRRLLAEQRYRLLCLRLLGICAALLGLAFALSWGSVWLGWIRATGSPPPLDLDLPQRIYRHQYVVAMLLATLLPAVGHALLYRHWRVPAVLTGGACLALSALSGSRTVWLALAVAGFAALLLLRPPPKLLLIVGGVATVAGGIALLTGLLGVAMDRLLTSGTVSYRLDIWRSTIGIWGNHPWTGLGPGTIGIGLTLSDLSTRYIYEARHAHNALIQLAAEGGAFGLLAGAAVVVGAIQGRAKRAVGYQTALVGLLTLGAMSLTDNPFDPPNLVTLAVAYAALLAPFEKPTREAIQPRQRFQPRRSLTWSAAVVGALAVAAVNLAALAQARISPAVPETAGSEAAGVLRAAVALDPGLALYHRELGVALMARSPDQATLELERAIALDPADTAAMRALAHVRWSLGDEHGAIDAARRATRVRPIAAENWVVLALVATSSEADYAAAEALRLAPWLAGSPAWPGRLSPDVGVMPTLQIAAAHSVVVPAPRDALSLAWLNALTDAGRSAPDVPSLTGLEQVLRCDLAGAAQTYAAMGHRWAETTAGIVGRLMLARLQADPQLDDLLRLAELSQPDLAAAARGLVAPYSAFADPAEDQQLYRRMGIDPRFGGWIIPRTADALGAWMFAPGEAAARSIPASPLASCR